VSVEKLREYEHATFSNFQIYFSIINAKNQNLADKHVKYTVKTQNNILGNMKEFIMLFYISCAPQILPSDFYSCIVGLTIPMEK